ncbi:MAG: hypothetical protein Q4C70_01955 [Planctomycetia bacterium]|nr:hypothetical protein [Planctomycetia bacterium]
MKKYLWPILVWLALLGPFIFFGAHVLLFKSLEYAMMVEKPYPPIWDRLNMVLVIWGLFVAAPVGFLSSVTYIVLLENKDKNWWKIVLVGLLGIANFLTIYPILWLICHLFG